MTDLLGAASRIDDAMRALDRIVANSNGGLDGVSHIGIPHVMSETTTQLAAAMPNGLSNELRSFYIPYDAGIDKLATVRSQLAHLGAVTRAVHELGGVDHVVSQGGLDAIDGATDVVRRHLLLDASDRMRAAGSMIDERPFGVGMSRKARTQHVADVRRAILAPMVQLADDGVVDGEASTRLAGRFRDLHYDVTKDQYDQVLRDARSMVDQSANVNPATLPAPSAAWTERMLVSTRARAIAAEAATRTKLPTAPRLSTLADDASVLANSGVALEQHAATFEALHTAVGDANYYSPAFREVIDAARAKIDRAAEDLLRINQLLSDTPDALRTTSMIANDWVSYNARYANRGTGGGSVDSNMLTGTLSAIRSLQKGLAAVVDEPELLRAGTDIADEVQEVLTRPGARLDLEVLRGLLGGDTASRAKAALVQHVPSIKPHTSDTLRTTDVQHALQLLDEAELIGTSLSDQVTKGRWVPIERSLAQANFPDVTAELLNRADTALGTSALVGESAVRSLETSIAHLRKAFTPEARSAPRAHDLSATLKAVRGYRTELASRAERASVDGGLRAITPSARPAQALEARSRWILRELDALTAPAADASSADHIDHAARRASIVHDLLRVAQESANGPLRTALVERAATEYQSLGETWRMPDDVARWLWQVRDDIQRNGTINIDRQLNATLPGYNTNPGMNRARGIATGLQSWSMFTDGPLPETAADRLSVAARRAGSTRQYVDNMIEAHGEKLDELPLWAQLGELRAQIAGVNEIAQDAVPGHVQSGLDELLATIGSEVERRSTANRSFEKHGPIPATLWDGRTHLDAWVAALEDAHRTARATAADEIAW
ncbi:MAG: hypothetical protein JWL76_192 [Thermoleophilia bacterium]|nr:hypothetical protein [Thermoleophilia bacterium]